MCILALTSFGRIPHFPCTGAELQHAWRAWWRTMLCGMLCRRPLPEPVLLRKAAGMPQTVYIYPDGNLTLSAKAEKASIAAPTPSKSYQVSPLRIIVVRASSYSVSICMAVEGKEHLRSHRRNMQSSPAVAMRLSWCRAKSTSLMGMEWAWLMLPLCCIALKSCSCTVRITFRCIKMYLTELRL